LTILSGKIAIRFAPAIRRGGRAVECTGLENRQIRKGFGSSNLPLSANKNNNLQEVTKAKKAPFGASYGATRIGSD
jgi:hypothetical protein